MLSRTADHLFWMSRYIERAEGLACRASAQAHMSEANVTPELKPGGFGAAKAGGLRPAVQGETTC
ncbi:alpha-E domain-containing protein [Quatrionicoccus australiensis]|uniref:alpha-E domain-containing protein n=1 Tax=Quatrionicoccus australiensis TaxID=138118 RepID=UPI001CF8C933|nr:alpha-E domain-containing protein [Quatrionicoccus australiensis]